MAYSKPTISGYNTSPPSDDGSETEDNKVKWSTIKGKITDPVKVYADAINDNTETAWNDLASIATDDGTKGFHLVNYPPLSGETGVTNYEYPYGDVRRYGAVGDDDGTGSGTDSAVAFQAAADSGFPVFIPDVENISTKQFYISTPIVSSQGLAIRGVDEIQVAQSPYNPIRGAIVYAPNGFLVNSTTTKHYVSVSNVAPYGSGTGDGKVCIDGYFGGEFVGNSMKDYDILVKNAFSYLTDFRRNKFGDANIGLYLASANAVNIKTNWFDTTCLKPIDTFNLTPAAGGSNASFLLVIDDGNNFNIGSGSLPSVLSGLVSFNENYVECFSAAAGDIILDYVAMRFAYPTLEMHGNVVNGQGYQNRFLNIYSDYSAGTFCRGDIYGNWLGGFLQEPILIGSKGSYYDKVEGIEFNDNYALQADYVKYTSTEYGIPEQIFELEYTTGTLDISSGTLVTIPVTLAAGFPVTNLTSGVWTATVSGRYEISATVVHKYTAAKLSAEFRLYKSGSIIRQAKSALALASAGTNRRTVTVSAIMNLNSGHTVYIQAKNGDIVELAYMSIKKIAEPEKFTV